MFAPWSSLIAAPQAKLTLRRSGHALLPAALRRVERLVGPRHQPGGVVAGLEDGYAEAGLDPVPRLEHARPDRVAQAAHHALGVDLGRLGKHHPELVPAEPVGLVAAAQPASQRRREHLERPVALLV